MDDGITEWLRPEFEGRDADLVSLSNLAKQEGVAPETVYSWQRRHKAFPKIVKLVRGAKTTTKYVSLSEFAAYKKDKEETRPKTRGGKSAVRRPAEVIARERLEALKGKDMKLEAQEKELAAALADILRQRQSINREIQETKKSLRDTLKAIQAALGDEQP